MTQSLSHEGDFFVSKNNLNETVYKYKIHMV